MVFLLLAAVIGLIPAAIAHGKGHNFFVWWIYGGLLFIVALPHAILMRPDGHALEREQIGTGEYQKCPLCAEIIKADALVCRYCHHDVSFYNCHACGADVTADDEICPGCGASFEAEPRLSSPRTRRYNRTRRRSR